MKFTPKQYARAIFEALKGKSPESQKELMTRFLKLLRKNGDWAKNAAILSALEKLILKEKGLKKVYVEAPQEIKGMLKYEVENIFGRKVYFSQKTNSSLLGGIKILIDDEILIDASAKRQIERMFHKF